MQLIAEKKNYDAFLNARFVSGSFLQSSIWQDFLKEQGLNFWQTAVVDNNQTIAVCLFYENKLPFGKSYLYSPKGPVISDALSVEQKQEVLALILSKLRDTTIATKQYQEIFYQLEPAEDILLPKELIKSDDIQHRDSWVLDIDKSEAELLVKMHAKTRYNINLAKKKEVKIRFSTKEEDLKYFLELIKQTAARNQISVHSDYYYTLLFKTLIKHKAGQICLAAVKDKVVAANLIIRFGKAVTYLHGASDYFFRSYMAPQLLQWETIKQAKELGYTIYDLGGVAPSDGSKAKWVGLTRFKQSFGGRLLSSPGSYSLIYNTGWYNLYKLAKTIKQR